MPSRTQEEIMADLAGILRDFEGREYYGDINPETLFFDDLGMASLDAVVLAEKLENHYQRKFPFSEFVEEMRQRDVFDIAVGDLAAFLNRHM